MLKKKKIGIVVNAYWNINNYRRGLIDTLKADNYDIILFSPVQGNIDPEWEDCCKIVKLKFLSRKSTNPFKDILFFLELMIKFWIYNPALLLLYTPKPNIYGSIAAAWTGRKSIATITGLGYSFISGKINYRIISGLYKFSLKRNNHVYFHNEDDRKLFLNNSLISEKKSSVVNGSGVDLDFFKAQEKSRESNNFSFLFMGRLLYDKGIKELIDAFKLIIKDFNEIELVLLAKIDKGNPSSINVELLKEWLNEIPNISHIDESHDVRPFIANADTVILPSYREGLPKGILEAMGMEKPIIVSDVPGCKQTVSTGKPSNGFLCTVKDSLSLAEKMKQMISLDNQQRLVMGKKGRQMALELFDEKIINKEYLQKINRIIGPSET